MNKTVNINLAGVFFHIDEDAFMKLKSYLDTIKHSFTNSQGRDEIIHDIEARIAELFSEKMKTDRQVISLKEVEEVIEVMGQPEDYKVDDDLFEDEEPPKSSSHKKSYSSKKLYRDTETSYIGGVCAGLGHYMAFDAVWIRLLFVILAFATGGSFAVVYLIFWIAIPEAKTTSEKLEMRGEPINISNIERKVKEGFDAVADKMKGVDYKKYGNKASSGISKFFDTLAEIIKNLFKVLVKFIGILIILFAGSSLIGLIFSLLSIGTFKIFDAPWMNYVELANIGAPLWLISLFVFFAAAIPFFFLFMLGLKILSTNLKPIGVPTTLVLLGVWLTSIFFLGFLGIRQATERAFEGKTSTSQELAITARDTLSLKMRGNDEYGTDLFNTSDDFVIKYDEKGNEILYSEDVQVVIKSTKDTTAQLEITKTAEGKSFREASKRADAVEYHTMFTNKTLYLDGYFTTTPENLFRDQEVHVTLYLPEGTVIYPHRNTQEYFGYRSILTDGKEDHYNKVKYNAIECLDCNDQSVIEETKNQYQKEESTQKEVHKLQNDKWYSETKNDTL